MATYESKLFQPIKVGDINLSHRIALAPLTRYRADENHVPYLPLVKEYYSQRASEPGILLITEATFIHAKAGGFHHVPGIWSDAQIEGWKEIANAVHAKESYIFLQLKATGRTARPEILEAEGYPYVSASNLPMSERSEEGHGPPRPLTVDEIKEYAQLYAQAATNAVHKAGFDGVELHGANGFLIEQFLKEASNDRTDSYGGSPENRARFALEMTDVVVKAVRPRKTGLRLSPWSTSEDTEDKDPIPTYAYLVEKVKEAHPTLAYLHVVEPRVDGTDDVDARGRANDFLREIWINGPGKHDDEDGQRFISAGKYDLETATKDADTKGDIIAFGRRFLANPDLPYRLKHNIPLNPYDRATFYLTGSQEPTGYTDYPFALRDAA